MNYTIEIEENERTLEFQLDVECSWWETAGNTSGAWENCYEADGGFDILNVKIESVMLFDEDGEPETFTSDSKLFYLVNEAYVCRIGNLLLEDDNLLEAWKKHVEEDY